MRINKMFALAATALTGTLTLTGCGGDAAESAADSGDTPQVAVFTASYATPAVKLGVDMFEDQATEKGWEVSVSDSANDYNKLNAQVQDAISRDVDAIVMGYTSQEKASLGIRAANEADIPVFAIDAGVEPWDQYTLNVTSDNTQLATDSAQAIIEANPDGGQVLLIGWDSHPGIRARTVVAEQLFAENGFEVVGNHQIQSPAAAQEEALTYVQDYLQAHPGQDAPEGVWAGFDAAGLGATQAIESAGAQDVVVASMNGDDFAIEEIKKDGPFVATVLQDWPTIIGKVVTSMDTYFTDGSRPETNHVEVPGTPITRENASQY
ncbi:sugar ABC transporter substrate-binding protein [Kocuria dechangensis]|uniref:Sugar ABC transporter substrate-binding protein n=1 Tax=Kocuria dechangensis TaxID=1176249 RepID=A0A917LVF3_9MICC|nr:sugar ABC transporter substrate-binding protein [Kocuria dechangensis]GGG60010.1 sugar ABC transporter substrate-binding protein [Kocuria dechangensis]